MSSDFRHSVSTFFVRAFAVIGVLTTLIVVLIGFLLTRVEYTAPPKPDNIVLTINFDQPIVEQNPSNPIDFAIHEETLPLLDILRALDKARTDPSVKGVVGHFGSMQPSLAQAQEIRAALARFRESGKFTYAFGTTYGDFGNGNRAYYLASGFENIWLQPVGAVSLTGLAIEAPFGKTALSKLGVSGDFLRREEYKSVMESFTRDEFSPPVRANMQGMIDDMAVQISEGIASGRKWDADRVRKLMAKGPFTANEALKLGLVTHIGYAGDLEDEIKKKAGDNVEQTSLQDYLLYPEENKPESVAHIALIYGTGLITDHANGPADVAGGDVMSADVVAQAFNDAADDKQVKAILFRIDSPGGSPGASETIRAALIRAQKAGKPVFVSMGGVAASGGYWVAMSADNITADPGTLTGSIGVVAGKFTTAELMRKLGVSWDTLSTSENATLWSMTKEFTPEQLARMNAFIDETYHTFVQSVSDARKIPMEKMPDVAKGRVFTGAQAQQIGLVDQLGGYDVALAALRKKLDLKPDDVVSVELFPAPMSTAEKIFKVVKNIGIESLAIHAMFGQWQQVQTVLGPFLNEAVAARPVGVYAPNTVTRLAH